MTPEEQLAMEAMWQAVLVSGKLDRLSSHSKAILSEAVSMGWLASKQLDKLVSDVSWLDAMASLEGSPLARQ